MIRVEIVSAETGTKGIVLGCFLVHSTDHEGIIGKTTDVTELAKLVGKAAIDYDGTVRICPCIFSHSPDVLTIKTHEDKPVELPAAVLRNEERRPDDTMFAFSSEPHNKSAGAAQVAKAAERYLGQERQRIARSLFAGCFSGKDARKGSWRAPNPTLWLAQFQIGEDGEPQVFQVTWKGPFSWQTESYGVTTEYEL